MRRSRIVPILPPTRQVIASPLAMRFAQSGQVAVIPTFAALENMTKLTAIVGITQRSLSAQFPLVKRTGVGSTTNQGWSLNTVNTGALRFVWNRATTNLDYSSTETPGAPFFEPLWFIVTADQGAGAGSLVQFYSGHLGDRIVPLANGTAIDGTGTYGSDTGIGIGIGNATTPTANSGYRGDIWRVLLFDRVLPRELIEKLVSRPWDRVPGALIDCSPGTSNFGVQNWGGTKGRGAITGTPFPVMGPRLNQTGERASQFNVSTFTRSLALAAPLPLVGTAALSVQEDLAIAATLPLVGTAALSVTADIAASASLSIAGAATISVTDTLALAAALLLAASIAMTTQSTIAIAATLPLAGAMTLTSPVVSGPQITINAVLPLTVTRTSFSAILAPPSIVFSAVVGSAAAIPARTATFMAATGANIAPTSLGVVNGSSWLSATLVGNTVTMTATKGTLAAGTYVGSVEIYDGNATPHVLPVVLNLSPAGQFRFPRTNPPAGVTFNPADASISGRVTAINDIPAMFLSGGSAPVHYVGSNSADLPGAAHYYAMTPAGFQAALTACARGEVIVIESQRTYGITISQTGYTSFTLPAGVSGATGIDADWRYIISADVWKGIYPVPLYARVPRDGSIRPYMGGISYDYTGPLGDLAGFILFANSADTSYVGMVGLEVRNQATSLPSGVANKRLLTLLTIGTQSNTLLSQVPHHIKVDRCDLHGDWTQYPLKKAIDLHANDVAIIGNAIGHVTSAAQESHCVSGNNCDGRWQIENNNFYGAYTIAVFTNGDPPGLGYPHMPKDLCVVDNYCWRDPASKGTTYVTTIKDHFELKCGHRVWYSGNILDGEWDGGQTWSFVVKSTVQTPSSGWVPISPAPWLQSGDVAAFNNIIQNSSEAVLVAGQTEEAMLHCFSIDFFNNLVKPIDIAPFNMVSGGRAFNVIGPIDGLTIEHMTDPMTFGPVVNYGFLLQNGKTFNGVQGGGLPYTNVLGLVVENNILPKRPSAVSGGPPYYYLEDGSFTGPVKHGTACLDQVCGVGNWLWLYNFMTDLDEAGGGPSLYPQATTPQGIGNKYTSAGTVGGTLLHRAGGGLGFANDADPTVFVDWSLLSSSPGYQAGSDGRDMGTLFPTLTSRTARAISGAATGGTTPLLGFVPVPPLVFNAVQGGASPPSRVVSIVNLSGGSIAPTLGTISGGWLSAIIVGTQMTVTATLGATAAGTYSGSIQVLDPTATNSPATYPVTFVVTMPPSILVTPAPPDTFAASEGGLDPAPQTFTVSNGGGGTLAPALGAISGAWLSATLIGTTLTVSATTGSLLAGNYSGSVQLTDPTATNSPYTIPVTFNVAVSRHVAIAASLPLVGFVNFSVAASMNIAATLAPTAAVNFSLTATINIDSPLPLVGSIGMAALPADAALRMLRVRLIMNPQLQGAPGRIEVYNVNAMNRIRAVVDDADLETPILGAAASATITDTRTGAVILPATPMPENPALPGVYETDAPDTTPVSRGQVITIALSISAGGVAFYGEATAVGIVYDVAPL